MANMVYRVEYVKNGAICYAATYSDSREAFWHQVYLNRQGYNTFVNFDKVLDKFLPKMRLVE